jgi:pimeloyl-ACP methyl ester carboxylesterase
MKVYFISGLAADRRVFKYISLPEGFETVYLDWIPPNKNETLESYSLRLASEIDTSAPFALVGLSMGGMIAAEITKTYKPAACVLLCSVPTHKHFPTHFRWAYYLRLHRLLPVSLIKLASKLKRGLTADNKEDQQLLKAVIADSDPKFIRWAMHAILSWRNETIPESLWHIHGSRDEILPIRFTHPTHTVKGGNHLMIMSKAPELNVFLQEVFSNIVTKSL